MFQIAIHRSIKPININGTAALHLPHISMKHLLDFVCVDLIEKGRREEKTAQITMNRQMWRQLYCTLQRYVKRLKVH